jgi:hypothetical protein
MRQAARNWSVGFGTVMLLAGFLLGALPISKHASLFDGNGVVESIVVMFRVATFADHMLFLGSLLCCALGIVGLLLGIRGKEGQ